MQPLLAEPTPEQAHLLAVIYEGRLKLGVPNYVHATEEVSDRPVWPTFQYVERTLHQKQGLVAVDVLSTCPVIRGGGGAYGWVWHREPTPVSLSEKSRVALTVAGMSHLSLAQSEVRVFLDTLALMIGHEQGFIATPEEAHEVLMCEADLRLWLRAKPGKWNLDPRAFQVLRDLLEHEPSTWHSTFSADGGLKILLSRFLRAYGGITTAEQYLQRVIDVYTPPETHSAEPLHPSSLSLPEAIDYLNLAWRVHLREPLIRLGRVDVAAKLALDCSTVEEFESRLSGLCSTLDGLSVPDSTEGGKLFELQSYLLSVLRDESSGRVRDAIEVLKALSDLRVWREHKGTDERAARGMHALQLALPPADWGGAWRHVQARTVAALNGLREEIEGLTG